MKQKYSKVFTLFLCSIIFASLIAACSGKDNNASSNESSNTPAATPSKESNASEPTEAGPATVSIGTVDVYPGPPSYADDLPIYQEIEKKTNIKIKWETYPYGQYDDAMNLRIAAGASGLPDVILVPSGADVMDLGTSGVILPLEDLIEQHAPNIQNHFAENPDIKSIMTNPEGHMYSIQYDIKGSLSINPYAIFIRKDWLDTLGLPEPVTTDDFYNVLKAFKEKDPNGNGEADEIPLVFQGPTPGRLWMLGESWGLRLFYSQGYSVDGNGKVQYDFIDPRFKEFLAWLNKLYTEGLIDREFTTTGIDQLLAKLQNGVAGSGYYFLTNIADYNASMKQKAGFENFSAVAMIPLKGPHGDQLHETGGITTGNFAITAKTQNAEAAIKFIDYIYGTDEGTDYMLYGIEGETYTVENGKKQYTDYVLHNPDGLGATQVLRNLGGWPNLPYVQTEEAYQALNVINPDILESSAKIKPYLTPSFPSVIATKEEAATLAGITPDLQIYMDETLTKFVTGQESLDKFDDYVQQVKKIGIDKVLAVKQAQWERFSSSQ